MISRVAEHCFWLQRYLERADSMSRLLDVNLAFVLDTQLPLAERWRPLLIVSGEEPAFLALFGQNKTQDAELVQNYLVWEERNVASIFNSIRMARESARSVRETISLEMWEALNALWLWMSDGAALRTYRKDHSAFYVEVREQVQLLRGLLFDTMLHDEAFHFMWLGLQLERAGQTARILDLKHHQLGPNDPSLGAIPEEAAHWLAMLRTCTATEAFFKRGRSLTGPTVAEFLILDAELPRSVRRCLDQASAALRKIRQAGGDTRGERTAETLDALRDRLRTTAVPRILSSDVHDELTTIIDTISRVCDLLHEEFFDPSLATAPVTASAAARKRTPQ